MFKDTLQRIEGAKRPSAWWESNPQNLCNEACVLPLCYNRCPYPGSRTRHSPCSVRVNMPNQAKGRFVVLGQEDLRAALDSEGLIGVLDPGSVLGEEVEALLGHQPEAEAVKVDRPLVALQLQLNSLDSLD